MSSGFNIFSKASHSLGWLFMRSFNSCRAVRLFLLRWFKILYGNNFCSLLNWSWSNDFSANDASAVGTATGSVVVVVAVWTTEEAGVSIVLAEAALS